VEVEVAELTRLATTIDRWQDEVLAYFDTRATNAATERRQREDQIHPSRGVARGLRNVDSLRRPDPAPRRSAT